MKSWITKAALSILVVLFFTSTGCDELGKALSEKPNIKAINFYDAVGEEISGRPINTGETITAEVDVSGDDPNLTYRWQTEPANLGFFDKTDEPVVTWTAPNSPFDLMSLKITVTNKSGERDTDTKEFAVLDPTAAPAVEFVSPEDGTFIPSIVGEITIEVDISFTGGSVDTVWFFVADSLIKTDLTSPFRADWTNVQQFSGSTPIKVRARNATSPIFGENDIVVSIEDAVIIGGN